MPNLFADLPDELPEELVTVLAANENVRIERIISTGHASPDRFWYDQDEHEWVIVLKGAARLFCAGTPGPIEMNPGDWMNIPAHTRHRVERTSSEEPTVWLAVFY